MSIPIIREVHYTDDGCTWYQCLNCYTNIEMRNHPWPQWKSGKKWNYCPYCGCKFKGYMPESRLKEYYDDPSVRTRPLIFTFELWSRTIWGDGDDPDWEKDMTSSKEACLSEKRRLEEMMKDSPFGERMEFKYKCRLGRN